MAASPHEESGQRERTAPQKRLRWATQRVKGPKAEHKRKSIFNRRLSRRRADEKKRESAGSDLADPKLESNPAQDAESGDGQQTSRTIYFNIPLPDSERDEDGRPLRHYARNKIRTAKYTPLSFLPKNLWYQFHNIANVYFAIVIILGVSRRCWTHRMLLDLLTLLPLRPSPYSVCRIQVLLPYP